MRSIPGDVLASVQTRTALERLVNTGHELGTCAIPLAEFYSGSERGRHRYVDAFVDALTMWEIIAADGIAAGRARLERRLGGFAATTTDTLIATVARRVGATIVTENLEDFDLPGLTAVSLFAT